MSTTHIVHTLHYNICVFECVCGSLCVYKNTILYHISNVLLFIPVGYGIFTIWQFGIYKSKNRRKWLTTSSTSTWCLFLVRSDVLEREVRSMYHYEKRYLFYLNNFLVHSSRHLEWVIKWRQNEKIRMQFQFYPKLDPDTFTKNGKMLLLLRSIVFTFHFHYKVILLTFKKYTIASRSR